MRYNPFLTVLSVLLAISNISLSKELLITDDFGSISRCKTIEQIDGVARTMLSAKLDIMTIDFGSPDLVHYESKVATPRLSDNVQSLIAQGCDPYGRIVEKLQAGGIKVHGGMRMNDHHGQLETWTQWHQDNVEWSLGADTGARDWRSIGALRQMDYAVEGVRQYRLNIIKEALERYPLDGVQLNYNRSAPFVSAPKEENGKYMTEFIKGVRQLLDEAREQRGTKEPLQLGVIVPWDIDYCHSEGLEVAIWIEQELVDYICPGEWHYTDYNIPFYKWTDMAKNSSVKIYPKTTGDMAPIRLPNWNFARGSSPLLENSFNIDGPKIAAFAELAYSQGGDGMLLFNFYSYNFGALYPEVPYWTNSDEIDNITRQYYYCRELKYIPTEQYTFSEGSAFDRLPLEKVGDKISYEFNIGSDLTDDIGLLRFKMKDAYGGDKVKVIVNGKHIEPVFVERFKFTSQERILRPDDEYWVSIWQRPVDSSILNKGANRIEIELISVDKSRKEKLEICEFEVILR